MYPAPSELLPWRVICKLLSKANTRQGTQLVLGQVFKAAHSCLLF
jgi:hypothetical protein